MAGLVFTSLLQRANRTGKTPGGVDARQWFRDQAMQVRSINTKRLMMDPNKTSVILPGKMYHVFYDPKHAKTLPYYDKFPLIFPFRIVKGGFYAINLHYLPPDLRAKLMDTLYDLTDKRYKKEARLRLSYQVLQSAAKYRFFKPCVKQYLTSHLRSRFLEIPYEQWELAVFLPTERFEKATKAKVWSESRSKI